MKYRINKDVAAACLGVLLLSAAMLVTSDAQAQARGPSVTNIQQSGQPIIKASKLRDVAGQFEMAREQQQLVELRNDPGLLDAKTTEAEAFLQRLSGQFRIEGRIDETRWVSIPPDNAAIQSEPARLLLHRNISGSAVCSAGAGAGIQCSIDADWLPVSVEDRTYSVRISSRSPESTVLALSVDAGSAQVRADLTAAGAVAEQWMARLEGDAARSVQIVSCGVQRCFNSIEVGAAPGGGGASIVIRDRRYTISLTLHRDSPTRL